MYIILLLEVNSISFQSFVQISYAHSHQIGHHLFFQIAYDHSPQKTKAFYLKVFIIILLKAIRKYNRVMPLIARYKKARFKSILIQRVYDSV